MSIPTSVRVGPFTYSVLTDPDEIRRVSDEADTGDGEWDAFSEHDRLVIGINTTKARGAQQRDLVHELLHCCLRVGGVWPDQYADVLHEARGRDGGVSVEEFGIAGTAAPLLGILRDNPDLVKWLLS